MSEAYRCFLANLPVLLVFLLLIMLWSLGQHKS